MSDITSYSRLEIDARGVAWLTLDRPAVLNAFDDHLIGELNAHLDRVAIAAERSEVRALVLRSEGKHFSAGADLGWMERMADYSEAENLADARKLAHMVRVLNELPRPTVARVQGAAFGGGVGLVAACDIALASHAASFCLSEARLGLIPSVISPYVVEAIGARAARRYFQTAERIDAEQAQALGLVHEVVPRERLDSLRHRSQPVALLRRLPANQRTDRCENQVGQPRRQAQPIIG